MAIIVRIKQQLERLNGTTKEPGEWPLKQTDITTTSEQYEPGRLQTVGTSHEVLEYGDMTDDCLCKIRNLHATATVQVGVDVAATFYPLVDIPPGEEVHLPRVTALASTYLQSDTVSTDVLVTLHKIAS